MRHDCGPTQRGQSKRAFGAGRRHLPNRAGWRTELPIKLTARLPRSEERAAGNGLTITTPRWKSAHQVCDKTQSRACFPITFTVSNVSSMPLSRAVDLIRSQTGLLLRVASRS